MDSYLFAKVDSSGVCPTVPAYLERSKLFDSHRDYIEKQQSKALWSQPVTKRGRLVKSSLKLPAEIVLESQSVNFFSVEVYPAFGGLIIDSAIWNLFSNSTKGYFLKCPIKIIYSGDGGEIEGSYFFLKHTSEIDIVDDKNSTLIGSSKFSGKFDEISQIPATSDMPEIFYAGDLSEQWMVLASWADKNFQRKIKGLEMLSSKEFCLTYNRIDMFTRMMKMNKT